MKINHIGIWVRDLEKMKDFYARYFGLIPGEKYSNPRKGFSSFFLSSPDGGASIELMHKTGIEYHSELVPRYTGIAHLAFSAHHKPGVDQLTHELVKDNYKLVSGPRTTGDGYYESVIMDPEGNLIEITV